MIPSARHPIGRCMKLPVRPAELVGSVHLSFRAIRCWTFCKARFAAAAPSAGPGTLTSPTDNDNGKGGQWGENEFGSLQKKAAARLHRFYVPQPLGPHATTPSLEALIAAAAPAPAAAATPAPSVPAAPPPAAAATATAIGATGAAGAAARQPPAAPPPSVVLEGEEARHAARSLRLQPGDRLELCDGRGNIVEGVVSGSDKQRVWVAPDGPVVHVPWRGSRWVAAVACTTLKGGRAEWLVEKLTELGAAAVVPLVTERSQAGGKAKFRTRSGGGGGGKAASYDGGGGGEPDGGDFAPGRLERVAIAATKQSLRPHAPYLAPPTPLADILPLVRRAAAGNGGSRPGSGGGGPGGFAASHCRTPHPPAAAAVGVLARHGAHDLAAIGPAAAARAGVEVATEDGGGSGDVYGGDSGRGFCLVAVAGAPPLAEVLRDVRDRSPAGALSSCAAGASGAEASGRRGGGGAGRGEAMGGGGGAGAVEEAEAGAGPLRVLLVGPEGDFTPAELAALVAAGAVPVGLGANRLRTETAAVGLLAACLLTEKE